MKRSKQIVSKNDLIEIIYTTICPGVETEKYVTSAFKTGKSCLCLYWF